MAEFDLSKIKVEGEPEEVTEVRAKIVNAFKDLQFFEEEHKYILHGKELPSVSSITHKFQEPFNELEVAENYAAKHGETAEYWIKKWHYNSLKATTTGTIVHEFAEGFFDAKHGLFELMPESCKKKFNKEFKEPIPTRPKEEAVLQAFEDLNKDNLYFVMNETKVFSGLNPNKDLNPNMEYAGTFDLLYWYQHPTNPSKSGAFVLDWKTNKNLYSDYARQQGKMMFPPFNDLYVEDLGNYTIQLSAYQLCLEDIGIPVLGRRLLWLKDGGTYEKVALPNVVDKLRNVL